MLFNSYSFILIFLPISLILFHGLRRYHYKLAISSLVCCSLFFYGWWAPQYLALLGMSIIVNFSIGTWLTSTIRSKVRKALIILGIFFNLGLLGYFKYADFLITSLNSVSSTTITPLNILLPLAISFFTFQQITYIFDLYKGDKEQYSFLNYCLFVTFFPQLIAGPIVHHRQMMPQFSQEKEFQNPHCLSLGITLFSIGLFKKVFIADNLALFATPIFTAAAHQQQLGFLDAWCGALAYTGQLYFDFSGYSDMAIGLGHLFGITLPINFFSPYKAKNIAEFWQRWHCTLSTFLRDYVYFPLGGSRGTRVMQLRNLILTMFIGGLWHGAAWTFVVWGLLHGCYLAVFHIWKNLNFSFFSSKIYNQISVPLGTALTFVVVLIGWVIFRAPDFTSAFHLLNSMFSPQYLSTSIAKEDAIYWLIFAYVIIWFAPNPYQLLKKYHPALALPKNIPPTRFSLSWQPNTKWAVLTTILFIIAFLNLANVSEFLYFQF